MIPERLERRVPGVLCALLFAMAVSVIAPGPVGGQDSRAERIRRAEKYDRKAIQLEKKADNLRIKRLKLERDAASQQKKARRDAERMRRVEEQPGKDGLQPGRHRVIIDRVSPLYQEANRLEVQERELRLEADTFRQRSEEERHPIMIKNTSDPLAGDAGGLDGGSGPRRRSGAHCFIDTVSTP